MSKIRIQKYLSQEGVCSRREAERFIENGWILVNGKPISEPGTKIDPEIDTVELTKDAKIIQENYYYIAFHKPVGIVTNCSQTNEEEIRDLLPSHLKHLSSIGRLDKDSEGLILLTDDGQFAKKCLASDHERVYEVTLSNPIHDGQIQKLEKGLTLFGRKTRPLTIQKFKANQIKMTMYEGKNRQIRRMMQKIGLTVIKLKRIQYGPYKLDTLKPKSFKSLEGCGSSILE